MRDGRADIGIVAGSVDTLGLESIHFSTDRLVLVTSRQHRFAQLRTIAFAETLDEDAIGMQQGSTLQAFLDRSRTASASARSCASSSAASTPCAG